MPAVNVMSRSPDIRRVLIQFNCISHYRARILELLTECEEAHFTVLADTKPDTPFLKTVTGEDGRAIRAVHAKTRILNIPGLSSFYWQPGALAAMIRERPDTVIAVGTPYSLTAWTLLVVGKFLRIPVLLWGHGLLKQESGPKWWVRRTFYRLAAGQMLYGDYARDLLRRKGFDPDSLYVVYNSLDFDLQSRIAAELTHEQVRAFRNALGVGEGEGLVVFTGRLQPYKRLDLLVRALAVLAERGLRVHAALIGEGEARACLAQLAAELRIDQCIHFLGENYDERYLAQAVGASDLAVIPAAAGLSVIHALAFGTPVVLHDQFQLHGPEWEAVEEGKTGFFYRAGDIEDLAEKIEHALFPVPVKTAMTAACKAVIAEKYNPHRQVKTFVRAVSKTTSSVKHAT